MKKQVGIGEEGQGGNEGKKVFDSNVLISVEIMQLFVVDERKRNEMMSSLEQTKKAICSNRKCRTSAIEVQMTTRTNEEKRGRAKPLEINCVSTSRLFGRTIKKKAEKKG